MTRKERERWATAYHEAGHAVVAAFLGLRFTKVTIKPGAETMGHIALRRGRAAQFAKWRSKSWNEYRARRYYERRIKFYFAGLVAEGKFLRRPPKWGFQQDFTSADDSVGQLCGSQEAGDAWLNWLFLEAKQLVESNWPAINAVAQELFRRETIREKDAFQIIRESINDGGRP